MKADFRFLSKHHELMARDDRFVLGWRHQPKIIFERGQVVRIIDVDDNEYVDMTSGLMC